MRRMLAVSMALCLLAGCATAKHRPKAPDGCGGNNPPDAVIEVRPS